jgi:hypothetical protein
MTQLRIIFTGLCAGGPPGPMPGETPTPVDGPYQVVMPASRPRQAQRSPHYTIPVHLPFIAARYADLVNPVDPARRLESCHLKNELGEECYVWLLSRERVTFRPDGDEMPLGKIEYTQENLHPGIRPEGTIHGKTDVNDVNWIPDMRLIWPGAARLLNDCVPPGKNANVAVQLTLNSGTLSARFPKLLALTERPSRFDPVKASPVFQVITRQALFVVELPEGTQKLEINSCSIDSGQELTPIELRVGSAAIELIVGNTDLDDLFRTVRGEYTQDEYDIDCDFELYYDILDLPKMTGPPDLPVPIPDPHHGGHGDCPKLRVELPGETS